MMEKELLDWKSQYRQLSEQLEKEQKYASIILIINLKAISMAYLQNFCFRETQEMIEPMKETLNEIDSNMKTQLDKICQVKSQILKNDQKIQRLLNGHL